MPEMSPAEQNAPLLNPKLQITQTGNRLTVKCERVKDPNARYRFTLEKDGEVVHRYHPIYSNTVVYWMDGAGSYVVKLRVDKGETVIGRSTSEAIVNEEQNKKAEHVIQVPSFLTGLSRVFTEVVRNWDNMIRLAIYDYRLRNKDSKLGKLWSIINPMIQILTYWLVFGIGLRSGQPVDGHPFLVWMLMGIIPWFYISSALSDGSNAIHSNAAMVLRMKYPLSTLPVQNVIVPFIEHMFTMVLLLIVVVFFGYTPNLHWLNLIYYQLYAIFAAASFALITSTLTMIARDYQKLLQAIIRLLFYITPILWTIDKMPKTVQNIISLNPIYYVVKGYRNAILYGKDFWMNKKEALFFWGIALVLYIIGATLFQRYRDRFNDML